MTMIDALEPRRMLADTTLLRVKTVTADNRGEILVQFSERATGVKGSAFQVYTAGADGKLYTSDDKRETVGFTYSKAKKLLRIVADIPKDTPYRLKLDGKTRIKSEANGSLLDGDFVSASRASGDGVAGGNYEMQVQRDKSATPNVKMRTNNGEIMIRVRKDVAPISANAFLTLANKGTYDDLLVTRAVAGFVVQLGALKITGDGNESSDLVETTGSEFGVETPRVLSNVRGTLSFARSSAGVASNEFFFNLTNNSAGLDQPAGLNLTTFTPFAEVTTSAGFDTLDTIAAKQTVDNDVTPIINDNPNGDNKSVSLNNVPIDDFDDVTDGTYRPARDGVIVERTAVMSVVVSKNG